MMRAMGYMQARNEREGEVTKRGVLFLAFTLPALARYSNFARLIFAGRKYRILETARNSVAASAPGSSEITYARSFALNRFLYGARFFVLRDANGDDRSSGNTRNGIGRRGVIITRA